ncbi:acetyl-CoA carboxylase carboxyl transferase subunit alpha, partial [Escherichia coli]
PVIATVLGEGGSGGALGIGVADRVIMLSHSIYSVISPEGCASILWKTAEKAEVASEALALTADKLQKMGIVEYVVDEGEGAHLNPDQVMNSLKAVLKEALNELQPMEAQERCEARYQRLMKFGSDNLGLVS